MESSFPVLVGDIGGTNARFALVEDAASPARPIAPMRIAQFPAIDDAIDHIVADRDLPTPASMMLAIATPLVGETFRLTNAPWVIDPARLLERFGLSEIVLMNDFAAQGLAALALGPEDLVPVGGAEIRQDHPKVVIGPGTGLGIAQLFNVAGKWAVIPGEGGHVDLGPRGEREMAIWPFLNKENGRMSAECALSGRGLENLYRAICALEGTDAHGRNASEISQRGLEGPGTDPHAAEAVTLFLTLLARVAGDMALLSLAHGGVFIAGGIAAKMLPGIVEPRFRAEFDDKAPHTAIMKKILLHVMTHPTAALAGLSACVREPDRFSLEGATLRFGA